MKFESRIPGIDVILVKNIVRTTLNGSIPTSQRDAQTRQINLTKYIGDGNSVRVNKSVREPAGAFSITLTEQLFYDGTTNTGDSLYSVIEPMDYIEIRMTGNAYKQSENGACSRIPMIMRGFISRIAYSETMGADGHPHRNIVVSGQDYGKILQMIQLFYMPGTPESNNYMTEFPFFAQYGIGATVQNAVKFMQDVFNNVVNPYVAALREYSSGVGSPGPLIPISLDFSSAIAGTVSPFGAGGFGQGTIWELIKSFGDIGTWNEFFIEDREDAPYAVYRPNPFMDAAGLPIFTFPAGKFPGLAANQVQITRADVVSISAERSDSDVANYFWVDSPRFNLCYEPTMRSMAVLDQTNDPAMGPYVTAYQNVDPQLYGTKKMWEQTQQGGQDETINGNGVAAGAVRDTNQTSFTGWMKARRTDMVRQNRDNVIFERGSMRLKGNESIRAGTYLSYEHGDYTSLYYVVSVEHDYAPFGNFFTSVQFERGTNFMDRVRTKADTDSPYLSEMVDLS